MFKFIRFTVLCNRVDNNKQNSLIYIFFVVLELNFLMTEKNQSLFISPRNAQTTQAQP